VRRLPTVLLILALPAGVVGYLIAVRVIEGLSLPAGLEEPLSLTVPLFVAGLCMLPFVAPTFDRMARRDLAAHRAEQARPDAEIDGPTPPADADGQA
jgi:hypothetical protein